MISFQLLANEFPLLIWYMSLFIRFAHVQLSSNKYHWNVLSQAPNSRQPELFHVIERVFVHQTKTNDEDIGVRQGREILVLLKK